MKNNIPVRLSKVLLVGCAALFSTLVVFNNLVDYQSNYLYVMHVMSMDTTGNITQAQWRSFHSPRVWQIVYALIIFVEVIISLLCWLGALQMFRNRGRASFDDAKAYAIYGLTFGVALWFLAFMGISGEWFLAWQSKFWNGIQPGFRVACVFLLTLIYVNQYDANP